MGTAASTSSGHTWAQALYLQNKSPNVSPNVYVVAKTVENLTMRTRKCTQTTLRSHHQIPGRVNVCFSPYLQIAERGEGKKLFLNLIQDNFFMQITRFLKKLLILSHHSM